MGRGHRGSILSEKGAGRGGEKEMNWKLRSREGGTGTSLGWLREATQVPADPTKIKNTKVFKGEGNLYERN